MEEKNCEADAHGLRICLKRQMDGQSVRFILLKMWERRACRLLLSMRCGGICIGAVKTAWPFVAMPFFYHAGNTAISLRRYDNPLRLSGGSAGKATKANDERESAGSALFIGRFLYLICLYRTRCIQVIVAHKKTICKRIVSTLIR